MSPPRIAHTTAVLSIITHSSPLWARGALCRGMGVDRGGRVQQIDHEVVPVCVVHTLPVVQLTRVGIRRHAAMLRLRRLGGRGLVLETTGQGQTLQRLHDPNLLAQRQARTRDQVDVRLQLFQRLGPHPPPSRRRGGAVLGEKTFGNMPVEAPFLRCRVQAAVGTARYGPFPHNGVGDRRGDVAKGCERRQSGGQRA